MFIYLALSFRQGSRSRPTTESISCWAFLCTSGLSTRKRKPKHRAFDVVSEPAKNRSTQTASNCSSESDQFFFLLVFIARFTNFCFALAKVRAHLYGWSLYEVFLMKLLIIILLISGSYNAREIQQDIDRTNAPKTPMRDRSAR